jgi:ADP-heptose:LPS heptosyltransferase
MKLSSFPQPEGVDRILIWHQGALGDLLLAGPALLALRKRYPRARLVGLGHPERWGLLSRTLALAEVWDSGESRWAPLFADGPLPAALQDWLAPFSLALVFTPSSETPLPGRLRQAGIPAVYWVPSFPEGGREAVAAVQAGHLAQFGLKVDPDTFRLALPEPYCQDEFKRNGGQCPPYISGTESGLVAMSGAAGWLAVAPGSGQAAKNWPLTHYYEVSRALSWEHKLGVVWLAGPAEASWTPYLQALAAAQGHVLLAGAPLRRVAAALSRCRLFLGNDSGLTHLAAALGGPQVLALFGPTDPKVWAPPGDQVRVLTGPCQKAPCARGREIACPKAQCLEDLAPEQVLAAAGDLLAATRRTG